VAVVSPVFLVLLFPGSPRPVVCLVLLLVHVDAREVGATVVPFPVLAPV